VGDGKLQTYSKGWIGVDLDGTTFKYLGTIDKIGPPIRPMIERIQNWLMKGIEVRIFTARVAGFYSDDDPDARKEAYRQFDMIRKACIEHIGHVLPITCLKDYNMIQLWDDRAVHVVPNTGEACCDKHKRSH
jgi:hypothetical protein